MAPHQPKRTVLERLDEWRAELNFDRIGIADATVALSKDFERYEEFIDAGMHGTMDYLARYRSTRRRIGPEILPGARSVIVVVERYAVDEGERIPADCVARKIARYARGRDYHGHFRRRLRKFARKVETLEPGARARAFSDTAPLLERAWARRAGVGFVGKNGMLIVPGLGSYVLLGEVVTTVRLPFGEPMLRDCASCSACLDACPTGALVAPYRLDARKCISYLTIEHRGDPGEGRLEAYDWVFGCDTCQEVCPYNRAAGARIPPGGPYDSFPRWIEMTPEQWLEATDEQILGWGQGSPLKRAKPDDWRRNAIGALTVPLSKRAREALVRLARDPTRPDWLRRRALAKLDSDAASRADRGSSESGR